MNLPGFSVIVVTEHERDPVFVAGSLHFAQLLARTNGRAPVLALLPLVLASLCIERPRLLCQSVGYGSVRAQG